MLNYIQRLLAFCLALVLMTAVVIIGTFSFAQAQNSNNNISTAYFSVYAGYFDILDSDNAPIFGAEYKSRYLWQELRAISGISMDVDGGLYGYIGANWDFILNDWIITPSVAAGGYKSGGSKDLGHGIQFKSGIEINYKLQNNARIGLAFNHLSNAGLGDNNPGAESLLLSYSHPISWGD